MIILVASPPTGLVAAWLILALTLAAGAFPAYRCRAPPAVAVAAPDGLPAPAPPPRPLRCLGLALIIYNVTRWHIILSSFGLGNSQDARVNDRN